MTLVPWFVEVDTKKLNNNIEILAKKTKPLKIHVGERAMFGANQDVPVRLIEPNPKLATLHSLALYLIYDAGGTIEDFNYIAERYKPHITLRHDEILEDTYELDNIALISAEPRGSHMIERVYKLDG